MQTGCTTSRRNFSSAVPFIKNIRNQALINGNIRPSKGTLLHRYAKRGNEKMVQYLVNNGFSLETKDSSGNTALMIGVKRKNNAIIDILLSAGSDILEKNKKNKTVLSMICAEDYFTPVIGNLFFNALCKQVLSYVRRARILMTAGCTLYMASTFFSADVIGFMAQNGIPVNTTSIPTKQSSLHYATITEDIDCVNVLLKYKADASAEDSWGYTPLGCIYQFCIEHTKAKIELLKILLHRDISPTASNSLGIFHISYTLFYGNNMAIRAVLQSGIDFSAKDELHGRNILHYIATNKNPGLIEELKFYVNKFDLTAVDDSNLNSLHKAAMHGNLDMIQFLLQHGVAPNDKDKEFGRTPLYYAYADFEPEYESQFDHYVQILLESGANPQFLVMDDKTSEQLTIFDVAKNTNSLSRMRPVIAQLALAKGLGVTIYEIISKKIISHPEFRKYFNSCQKLIGSNVFGTVTLLRLLGSNRKVLARYSNNKELMLKLMRLSHKQDFKRFYPYYYNFIKKKLSNGIQHRIFLDKITKVLYKICNNRFDGIPLIISKIIDFLNDESLQQLHQV